MNTRPERLRGNAPGIFKEDISGCVRVFELYLGRTKVLWTFTTLAPRGPCCALVILTALVELTASKRLQMIKEQFVCRTDGGADLCFFGGICKNITTSTGVRREACECPPGLGRDYVLFHSDNCTLPDYVLLAVFLLNLVLSIGYIALLWRVRPKASNRALRVVNLANILVVLFAFELLALYLENGWLVATPIIVGFVTAAICTWGAQLGKLVALPVFSMNKSIESQVGRFIKAAFVGIAVVNIIGCIAMAATAYGEDLVPYNRAAAFFALSQAVTVCVFGIIIVYYAFQLDKRIAETDLPNKDAFLQKTKRMRQGALSIVLGQSAGVGGVVVFWILGSVPFHWIGIVLAMLSIPFSVVTTTLGIFRNGRSKSLVATNATPTQLTVPAAPTHGNFEIE